MANRWWTYQKERFPVVGHGVLILAFSFCAVSYSWLLRGAGAGQVGAAASQGWPAWEAAVVAFVTCFIFFLQLRIADEFKDFDEDSRYRPYRPVPRGLVTLRELAVVFVLGAAVQLGLAMWLKPVLAWLLAGVWLYLALMSREFFVRRWIRKRPITYLWTHMLIMPLIDFYATACDWLASAAGAWASPPRGLIWFVLVSFFNGVVIEIGRKIRHPDEEEEGVDTYSALWGVRRAATVWVAMVLVSAILGVVAALHIDFLFGAAVILGATACTAAATARRFAAQPTPGVGKRIETMAGLWVLTMYLTLGVVPLLWRQIAGS